MSQRVRAVSVMLALAVCLSSGCTKPSEPSKAKTVDLASLDKKVPGKRADAGIEWQGKPLPKFQALNRMRLMAQQGLWENLDRLSALAVTFDDKQLLAAGHWYRALLAGRANDPDLAMAHLQLATKNGFENASMMTEEESLLCVQPRDDFQAMVKDLSTTLDRRMRDKFQKYTDTAFRAKEVEARPWQPDLKKSDGQPLFTPGVPSVAILTRTFHDGLPKLLSVLGAFEVERKAKLPVSLIFYQYEADDSVQKDQTQEYVQKLGAEAAALPWTVIGRDAYKGLTAELQRRDAAFRKLIEPQAAAKKDAAAKKNVAAESSGEEKVTPFFNHFPMLVFFDGAASPLYALEDVPADWQLQYAVGQFEGAVGKIEAPEEKPVEEKRPAEAPKPEEEKKPAEAPKPAEAAEPKPAETPEPVEDAKPAEEAPRPAETPEPVEEVKPAETPKPAEAPVPAK